MARVTAFNFGNGNCGIVHEVETRFNCPWCEFEYDEDWWYAQYEKSKTGIIYKTCRICKNKLGITVDFRGDAVAWLKKDERK